MTQATLSFNMSCHEISIEHNNRNIPVPHSDTARQSDNFYWSENKTLGEAYEQLFSADIEEYNATQKRKDRKIENYLQKITDSFQSEKEKIRKLRSEGATLKTIRQQQKAVKPCYEFVVSIGNMHDNPEFRATDGERKHEAKQILQEYIEQFADRYNGRKYGIEMYNASIHLDENGVAHGHIDIIFHSSDNARGMKHQVSMGKALKQLGFVGTTKILPITEWENSERSILSEMCAEHDIEIVAGKKSKKHLSKEEYVLEREKEHTREMKAEIVSEIKSIETFLNETDDGNRFMLSEDNEELREELDYYKSKDNMENEKLVELWDNYKSENQEYWHRYHESKTAMKNEMSLMMKNKSCDNARLKKLFGEIFYGNDFIIIRLIKVLAALYLKRRIAYEEEKIKELQDINKQLKREAKAICNLSSDTAEALKSKDFEKINATFEKWEATLSSIDKCIENRFEIGKNSSLER